MLYSEGKKYYSKKEKDFLLELEGVILEKWGRIFEVFFFKQRIKKDIIIFSRNKIPQIDIDYQNKFVLGPS